MEQVIWYHIALLTKPWNKIENMNIWKQSTSRADRNKFLYKEIPLGGKSKKIFETSGPQFIFGNLRYISFFLSVSKKLKNFAVT